MEEGNFTLVLFRSDQWDMRLNIKFNQAEEKSKYFSPFLSETSVPAEQAEDDLSTWES